MAGNARRILFSHLKELNDEELKDFKSLLEDYQRSKGHSGVSRRPVKTAKYKTVADNMLSRYDEEQALETAGNVLCQINRRDLSEPLLQASHKYLDQKRCENKAKLDHKKQYLHKVTEQFTAVEEKNTCSGKCFPLQERYTKLVILDGYLTERSEHEMMFPVRKHVQIMSQPAAHSYCDISELFKHHKHGRTTRIVVLLGAAGIGKTTTAQKIMLDWASGQLYQDRFEYVFYIHCREMNDLLGQRTIADLILHSYLEVSKPMTELMADPGKMLFIVDGFSEFQCSLSLKEGEHNEKTPMNNKISFLKKQLFEKSHIIITARPTALDKLLKLASARFVEILGFSEDDRKEYFNKFFGNTELGAKAFHLVRENDIFLNLCFAPIVCWIACTVVKQQMEKCQDLACAPKTSTSVYMFFLSNVLGQWSSDSVQPLRLSLKRLCALAKDGICQKKTLFEEKDINAQGLVSSEILSLFLKNDILRKDTDCGTSYSFIHMSIQEFFAAMFYVLRDNEESAEHADVLSLLEAYWKQKHSHLMLTVRFLFGLLNEQTLNQMEKSLQWRVSPEIKSGLLRWIKEEIKQGSGENIDALMDLFYCLYEIQDEEFVKSAMEHFTNIDVAQHINRLDMKVLLFCCKNIHGIPKIHISNYMMEREDFKALMPWLLTCSSLKLASCSLTDALCEDICFILGANPSLTALNLKNNAIGDSGMRQLCERLKHPGCNLQKLRVDHCSLTASCCADLASVLLVSPSLAELSLSGIGLGDSGGRQLCQGLKHPGCRLQKLRCSLTASCCADLASVFSSCSSLTDLNLNNSELGDSGVRQLCEGLKHPDCKIQKLQLQSCSLTVSCCADLSSTLCENQSLTELRLAFNELEDSGVRQLCEGLKQPGCKIQKLGLGRCSVTGPCFEDLASVLSTSLHLTELDLSFTDLTASHVGQLCEGLKHPACKIKTLLLCYCFLTESCCGYLASLLSAKESLVELDLARNALDDSGVRRLCEGLEQPGCKIQKMKLDSNGLTDDCSTDLCRALSKNQEIQNLSLCYNYFTDTSIAAFIQIIKTCGNLCELSLSDNCFSPAGEQQLRLPKKEHV